MSMLLIADEFARSHLAPKWCGLIHHNLHSTAVAYVIYAAKLSYILKRITPPEIDPDI